MPQKSLNNIFKQKLASAATQIVSLPSILINAIFSSTYSKISLQYIFVTGQTAPMPSRVQQNQDQQSTQSSENAQPPVEVEHVQIDSAI